MKMRKTFLLFLRQRAPALSAQVTPPAPAAAARPTLANIPIDRVVAVVGTQPVLWSDVLTFINQQRAAGMTAAA